MQTARSRLGVAEINNKIYAIGGDDTSLFGNCIGPSIGTIVNTTEVYDPVANTWNFKASMPTARCCLAIAVYQNKIYCIGGCTGYNNITGVNEVYDPSTDTWEIKTAMPTPRMDLQANVVNGKIYLIGGTYSYDIGNYISLNEVYDPTTDTWSTNSPPPNTITSGASAVSEDKIYFLARESLLDLGAFIQIYNPKQDSWTRGSASPTNGGVSTSSGVTSDSATKKIVFFDESSTYIYYPKDDTWSLGTANPSHRGFSGVTFLNGVFYIIGGIPAPFLGYIVMTQSVAINEQYTPNEKFSLSVDNKIYIRTNGEIEPSTANITTTDKVHYTCTDNNYGRFIVERNNIIIDGNGYTLQGTESFGLSLSKRQNIIVKNFTITGFQTAGIGIEDSSQIIIFANNLQKNVNEGIRAYKASNNIIAGNNITGNKYMSGIHLADNSNNNTIFGNNIKDNTYNFIFDDSYNNCVFHNNFIWGYMRALILGNCTITWDNGYPSGGNYWIDYNGVDPDGDGLGNKPYSVKPNNTDNYPLVAPFDVSSVTLEMPQWIDQLPTPSQNFLSTPTSTSAAVIVIVVIILATITCIGLLVYFKKLNRASLG